MNRQYNAPVHNYIYVPGKSISMKWQYNAPVHNYIYVPGKSISMNWQYNAPVHNSSILRQSVSRQSFTHAEKESQIKKWQKKWSAIILGMKVPNRNYVLNLTLSVRFGPNQCLELFYPVVINFELFHIFKFPFLKSYWILIRNVF